MRRRWIAGAYWFTSSTPFANPAVTVARTLTDTFAGIKPTSAPMFIAMQLIGGGIAVAVLHVLYPAHHTTAQDRSMAEPPQVLFVCVHNAGRSQMAAALLDHHAADRVIVRSAGTQPADQINPAVLDAIGAAVTVGAWMIGPHLPGAGANALVDTGGNQRGPTDLHSVRVDIRDRLVTQSNRELFVVVATEPDYWRETVLTEFDGNTWSWSDQAVDDVSGSRSLAAPGSTGGASRTWVVTAGHHVVAYSASSTAVVMRSVATKRASRNQPDPIPAILLGRLAVDAK